MRKALFALACLLHLAAQSQIINVNYRGAFAPAPTPMWTDLWCNWNPGQVNYPTANVAVTGNITSNTRWSMPNTYSLNGPVYVDSGVTLTIDSGVVVLGNTGNSNSCLIIKRGGKIHAVGTENWPIVFTSSNPVGQRALGDWGGVIILGRAVMNQGTGQIEGLAASSENQYGGNDDSDSSGVMSYVRIEYGGYVFAQNREINGLTLAAVGSRTKIDHIQVSFANDDAFEWFGGTVNCTHLVSYRNLDDDFDTDFGYRGNVQFGLAVRDPQIADNSFSLPSGGSTSEGFESDNDANGSQFTPQTRATFVNMTVIGPFRDSVTSVHPGFRRGARIRRNSALSIRNSVITDWNSGVFIDGPACEANVTNGLLAVERNIIANYVSRVGEVTSTSTWPILSYLGSNNDTLKSVNLMIRPYDYFSPDYRPSANSPMSLDDLSVNHAVYPNPSTGEFTIETDKPSMINIYNQMGQLVYRKKSQGKTTVDSQLPPGIYILEVNGSTSKVIVY